MTPYPKLVANLVTVCDAWIVGSAAELMADLSAVRDWDVIVPFNRWAQAAALIPTDAVPNRLGGWKCRSEGKFVDVWPDDITMLTASKTKYLWHSRSGARWVRH